jgi:hypothetical protein
MTGPRRLLLLGLTTILIVLIAKAQVGTIWLAPRPGVDMEIPMRAADRWLAGGEPYLAEAFLSGPGETQPFLYPPFTLPLFAAMTGLPRDFVRGGAVLLLLVVTIATCRRLNIPWVWMPLVIAWPPFAEGILDGNVQVLIFAAFVFLFYRRGGARWRPVPRDIAAPNESPILVGGLSVFGGAIKVSQPQAWVFVLRHRWRAAILGAALLTALVLATLPVTGVAMWFDWFAQLQRASDTTWDLGGFALPRYLPPGFGYVVAGVCLAAVWLAPRRDPAPWVGVLSVLGSLSLHIFGLLFLVPAMLKLRSEAVVAAAAFIATYAYVGSWAGTAVVLWCLLVATFGPETWRNTVLERGERAVNPSGAA